MGGVHRGLVFFETRQIFGARVHDSSPDGENFDLTVDFLCNLKTLTNTDEKHTSHRAGAAPGHTFYTHLLLKCYFIKAQHDGIESHVGLNNILFNYECE